MSWRSRADAYIEWSLKAAIISWLLGHHLQAVAFQNHAMERLFAALGRSHSKPQIDAKLLAFVHKRAMGTKLQFVLDDFVVRNWGDEAAVESGGGAAWPALLRKSENMRMKFVKGTLQTLEMRREKLMELEGYLIKEEV
jgi:hypothetical protein